MRLLEQFFGRVRSGDNLIPRTLPLPLGIAIALLAVAITAVLGRRFTTRGVGTGAWYATMARPSWMPDGRVIAAVWTGLFGLIAAASALVWTISVDVRFTSLLAINLVLNVLWWWLFFRRRSPPAALVELVALETTCIALVPLAGAVSLPAGLLLAPYAAWVAFAGVLNAAIVRRNRRRPAGGGR